MKTPNVIGAAAALAAAVALAAACGVANPFSPAAARSSSQDQLLKWAQCMRQHGVDVPDPVNGRITVQSTAAPGDTGKANGPDPGNPQFQAAQNACQQYAPNGGKAGGQPTQQQLDQATRFSQCMRDHGVNLPDPQVQPGGGIAVRVTPGAGSASLDPNSDQFKQAQQACARYLPGGGTRTTTGGGGSGSGATTGGNG